MVRATGGTRAGQQMAWLVGVVGTELQDRQRTVSLGGRASRPAGEQAHSPELPTSQSRALGHSHREDEPEGLG